MTQIIWADDDASRLLRPLQRLITDRRHPLDLATSYDEATEFIEAAVTSGHPFALLADIILPLAPGKGTLTAYRGIELAHFAIDRGASSVVFLTVVPRREVAADMEALRKLMPRITFFEKMTLLEPGRIDTLLNDLNGGRAE